VSNPSYRHGQDYVDKYFDKNALISQLENSLSQRIGG